MSIHTAPVRPIRRSGFSIIELLVVLFIIFLVVAITIPALGHARRTARKTETQALLASLTQAVVAFEADNRRAPGYFTAREMGENTNATRGFSAMQNVLLDLAGGVLPNQAAPLVGPNQREVGPSTTNTVKIDTDLVGTDTGDKRYFTPSRKAFIVHNGSGAGGQRFGDPVHVYPELTDAFGTPVLAWSVDAGAVRPVNAIADFALENTAGTGQARFYWVSNAAFLHAGIPVGKRGVQQGNLSMLGDATPFQYRARTMTGLLGNPNSAQNLNAPQTAAGMLQILPSAPRGSVVFHSAGQDGAFLPGDDTSSPSVREPGWKKCTDEGGRRVMDYGLNFRTVTGGQLTNNGSATTSEIIREFDDLVQGSGS